MLNEVYPFFFRFLTSSFDRIRDINEVLGSR